MLQMAAKSSLKQSQLEMVHGMQIYLVYPFLI
jgi:hypothetical protein